MKICCWNCRGIRGASVVPYLRDMVTRYRPQVLSLIETKLSICAKWQDIRCRLGFQHCFSVPTLGRSGGLAIMWNSDIDLNVVNYSSVHIDFAINIDGLTRFTLFYGNPNGQLRNKSWDLMRYMARLS